MDPDPDPATQINADPDADLDPQPCNLQLHVMMILHFNLLYPRTRAAPPPPLVRGEDTLAGWRGGGGSILWKTPDTACTLHMYVLCGMQYLPVIMYKKNSRNVFRSVITS